MWSTQPTLLSVSESSSSVARTPAIKLDWTLSKLKASSDQKKDLLLPVGSHLARVAVKTSLLVCLTVIAGPALVYYSALNDCRYEKAALMSACCWPEKPVKDIGMGKEGHEDEDEQGKGKGEEESWVAFGRFEPSKG